MLIASTLNEYAKKARRLRKTIDNFSVYNQETDWQFLGLLQEYNFITKLFSDMNIFNWSDDDFNIEI